MCGIVAYIGTQEAQAILLDGLRRLEYRGYDSAGIAVVGPQGVRVARCEGKLARLVDRVTAEPLCGSLGIGHTRWATHGRPSHHNAHPHRYGRVTIVHNGIIENHRQLREMLEARGHQFESETDSEILAHLIDAGLHKEMHPRRAVRKALSQVEGVYALCCLIDDLPDRFYCARQDAPLLLGIGEGEYFAASDIPATLTHTRQMLFLEEGDIVEVRRDGMTICDATETVVTRPVQEITWSSVMAEKEGYKHFMLKEIFEQPRAIADTVRGRISPDDLIHLDEHVFDPQQIRRIFLVACGTSYHAALVGKYLFEAMTRLPVEVDLGSEFRYRNPLIGPGDLLIAISQSGETADTKAAVTEAKSKGARVLALANVIESSIPRAADMALYTRAGPEIGVASTKAFTTQLVALYLVALYCAQRVPAGENTGAHAVVEQLRALPHLVQLVLQQDALIAEIAENYLDATDWLYLGRGINYPIALEGALKLKEISYVHAEGYAAGEMKHGPIALIDEHLPVVGIALQGPVYQKMMSNLEEVKARGGQLIALATEGDTRMTALADAVIFLPETPLLLQPVVSVVPLQLLAYHVADAKGTDVDQPRNLAKSVTVE